jgi:hypothetical protein
MILPLYVKVLDRCQRSVRSPHALVLLVTAVIALSCVSRSDGADSADSSARFNAIQQQLNKLGARLDTLEKNLGGGAMSGSITNLDARLGAVEAQVSGLQKSVDRPPNPPSAPADQETFHVGPEIFARVQALENQLKHGVTAPFVVRDASGKTILLVDGDDEVGGIVIGDPKGEHVSIGSSTEDGSAVLITKNGAPIVGLVGGKNPALGITAGSHSATIGNSNDTDQAFGMFLYEDNINTAALKLGFGGAGLFTLANAIGNITVDAGTTKKGLGIVRTGPSCCRPVGWLGPPEYLLGRQ